MAQLPLFGARAWEGALTEHARADKTQRCNRCPLSAGNRSMPPCITPRAVMPATASTQRRLLLVAPQPTADEHDNATGWTSTLLDKLVRWFAVAWGGKVLCTYAVQCAPFRPGAATLRPLTKDDAKIDTVSACRPNVRADVDSFSPDVIVAIGKDSIESLLGASVSANAPDGGYGFIRHGDKLVPVLLFPNAASVLTSTFSAKRFRDVIESWRIRCWGLSNDDVLRADAIECASYTVVSDVVDAALALTVLKRAEFIAFDTETGGRPFNRGFYVSNVACTIAVRSDDVRSRYHTFVFEGEDLRSNAHIRAALRRLLTCAVPKVGHNVKYDTTAIAGWCGGHGRPTGADTMVFARELNADASAKLQDVAPLAGIPGHKTEMQSALVVARKYLQSAVKKNDDTPPPNSRVTREFMRNAIDGIKRDDETDQWAYPLVDRHVLSRYNARDTFATALVYDVLRERINANEALARVADSIDTPAVRALARVEARGIAVSLSALDRFTTTVKAELAVIQAQLDTFKTGINWGSPQQVAAYLYDELKLQLPGNVRCAPRSTDEDALTALSKQHDVCEVILKHRGFAKLDGTYASGLCKHIRDDCRVHANYNVAYARTGRTSASDPNMQNQPSPSGDVEGQTPWGRLSRDVFASMTDAERDTLTGDQRRVFIARDESQLELRVAAALSNDDVMRSLFKSGVDFHQGTSDVVWGVGADKSFRKKAKVVNFAILFGKSDANMARELGVSSREAADIRRAVLGKFNALAKWVSKQHALSRSIGAVTTQFNGLGARTRYLTGAGSGNEYMAAEAERQAVNTPIQGTAADIVTASLWQLECEFTRNGLAAHIVGTVHDQVIVETELWCAELVDEAMKRAMEGELNGVPLVTDCEVGTNWGSLTKVKTTDELRKVLATV